MDASAFSKQFPRLYHLTFASNLPGIRANGLCSARSLGDLHSFEPAEREAALVLRRRCIQEFHGVWLRDQHAANERKMRTSLVNVTIPEWLSILNSKIFFFLDREKALRFAGAYADYDNLLLEVDTERLLRQYADDATLCRINAGSFLYNARPRGRDSFIPLREFTYRKTRDTPAELALDRPVPDILDLAEIVYLPRV